MSAARSTRPLGSSGLEITCTGLGAWAIGGGEWGGQDDDASVAALRRALELGLNWIDTAAIYGPGRSEQVIARALRGMPQDERPLIFTKCALELMDPVTWQTIPSQEPVDIRAELEGSLRRLEMDHVDLYQVHWPPREPPTPLEEYWQTMVDLRREGKVRAIGLSNHDVAQLEAAEAIGHVDSLQPPFSAIRRGAADELAWCAANGTGTILYSPMQGGLLTGAFSAERVAALPDDDWRREDANYTSRLAANLALADALAPIADRHGVSRPAVSIAWTLGWPGVTGAIVGARAPEQIDGWIDGCDLRLTDADYDEIAAAIERTGAGDGPLRPPR